MGRDSQGVGLAQGRDTVSVPGTVVLQRLVGVRFSLLPDILTLLGVCVLCFVF